MNARARPTWQLLAAFAVGSAILWSAALAGADWYLTRMVAEEYLSGARTTTDGDSLGLPLGALGLFLGLLLIIANIVVALVLRSRQQRPGRVTVSGPPNAQRNRADLEAIHKYCTNNRELLARSASAGCFHCEQVFTPSRITDWIDGAQATSGDTADGVTALCPLCGIDAVLPSAAPIVLDAGMLSEMQHHWFEE